MMEKEAYDSVFRQEESHWWYKGMREIVNSLLNKYVNNKGKLSILDVGCGTGFNLIHLKEFGRITGIDKSKYALYLCKKRGLKNVVKGSAQRLPFKDNIFDLVTSFDVTYHKGVSDDKKVFREIYRVCKKDGFVIIRNPSKGLFCSYHDLLVHTGRKYSKRELMNKLKETGFKIKKITYINFFLFPLVISKRILERFERNKKIDIEKSTIFDNMFYKIIKAESKLINYIDFPFGSSIICVCKK